MRNKILCCLVALALNAPASENRFNEFGGLQRIALGAGWLDVKTELRAPLAGWSKIFGSAGGPVSKTEANGRTLWSARLGDGQNVDIETVQAVRETPAGLEFEFSASAFKDSAVEGVILWLDLPAKIFARGSFETTGKDGKIGALPLAYTAENKILCSGMMDSATIKNADGSIALQANWSEPVNVTLQDERQWGDYFALMIYVHRGELLKGGSSRLKLTLKTVGQPDQTPAEFTLNPAKTIYKVQGLGGNYCFALEGPERLYTLEHLKPAIARTEISLQQWSPERGVNQSAIALEKMPGKLRLEFDTLRELAQRKIPFVASIWQAPAWLCSLRDPKETNSNGRFSKLNPEILDAAAEAVGTYLLFAKEKCQAEPEYFSFNEPDYGAQIKFTLEEHRDAIKAFGAHFKKIGLKTHQLLGDVSNPRVPLSYVQAALDDPEAMKFVGALSIHSWGGGTPEQYGAWSALAKKLNLPLFVAEAGVDPGAWNHGAYKSFDYALREMAHYQDIFRYAQPQAVLYWEYSGDYSLLAGDRKGVGGDTERFALQRHWLDFVRPGSAALEVSGMSAFVQLNVFKLGTEHTLQLSNTGWPRPVVIGGLPAGMRFLNVFQTSRGKQMELRQPVKVEAGVARFEMPAQAMWTLTDRRPE